MSEQLVRIVKRRASFAVEALQDVIDAEFLDRQGRLDAQLSVYRIQPSTHLVQVHTEHLVGIGLRPDHRAAATLEGLDGWAQELDTPTENDVYNFRFSSEAHRELQFASEAAVLEFASTFFQRRDSLKLLDVRKNQLKAYAQTRLRDNDPEWLEVCAQSEQVRTWVQND